MGKRISRASLARIVLVSALLGACDDPQADEATECTPQDVSSCEEGLVCERVGDADYGCLRPVLVRGRVFGAFDGAPVAGATVVGLDANGSARTRVVQSDAAGYYELPVSVRRDEAGKPLSDAIMLRVAAADHQAFPTAPRAALPIELAESVVDEQGSTPESTSYRIENSATDVSLIPLPEELRGGATLRGVVRADVAGGVLVLAVSEGRARSSAISDLDGAFVMFNVPTGSARIEGYRAGLVLTPQAVEVVAAGRDDITLTKADAQLSRVQGNLSIVNAEGGLETSVTLVVASTFDPDTQRGESPAGLRVADVGGSFAIEDVPPGRYAVLAAFENDELVRDPDEGIGGTDVVFVDVGETGSTTVLDQSFKVTEALAVLSPGADGVEIAPRGKVMLSWADDSSEDGYELRVYDAFGTLVHEDDAVARVSGSGTVSYALDTGDWQPGMLYQFRVFSYRQRQDGRTMISASEDLKGVFELAR